MVQLSFKKMVEDPFSFFNIFLIFLFVLLLEGLIAFPLLELFVYRPEGTSIFSTDGEMLDLMSSPKAIFLILLVQNVLFVLLIYLRVIRFGGHRFIELGVSTKNIPRMIMHGLGWTAVILVIITAVSFVFTEMGMEAETPFGIPEDFAGLALILVAGVIFAPIGEELFFRAYIVTAISARYNKYFAFLFSSYFFAILHLDFYAGTFTNLGIFVPLMIMGFFLAFIYHRYKNIIPCIIIHAVNNLIAILAIYYYGG